MRHLDFGFNKQRLSFFLWTAVAAFAALLSLSGSGSDWSGDSLRGITSLDFPKHKLISDVDDILSDYKDYLNFALEIGRATDPRTASLLDQKFRQLRKRDPEGAARFLRGLRFEMTQKLEFLGASPARITTQTPFMRRWVSRYMREWLREADEYLYRSYSSRIAKQ